MQKPAPEVGDALVVLGELAREIGGADLVETYPRPGDDLGPHFALALRREHEGALRWILRAGGLHDRG